MKKLGVVCLVLVIAIGCVGIAFAAWSRTLTVRGSVATGTYDVVFDSFAAPASIGNQTSFSATKTDNHNYTISLVNLYPGCDAPFAFALKDTGSIPAKITAIKINDVPTNSSNIKLGNDTQNDVTVTVQGISTSTTLDAGGTVTGNLVVHTWKSLPDGPDANDATPNASGSFTLEIDTEQNPAP